MINGRRRTTADPFATTGVQLRVQLRTIGENNLCVNLGKFVRNIFVGINLLTLRKLLGSALSVDRNRCKVYVGHENEAAVFAIIYRLCGWLVLRETNAYSRGRYCPNRQDKWPLLLTRL